jgi:hypothetical protein
MVKIVWGLQAKALLVVLLFLTGLIQGLGSTSAHGAAEAFAPSFEPNAGTFEPGLEVLFFDGFYKNIDQMPTGDRIGKGRPGKIVPYLNHNFDKGEVFDSGRNRGVGVRLTGQLLITQPGQITLKAKSNDGLRVFINDRMVLNDPAVHSDRFSESRPLEFSAPGYYNLAILYFQRKGTAALELWWKKSGGEEFSIIPAEAYAHAAR